LKGTRVPFDLGDLRVIFYEDRVGGEQDVIPKIQRLLASFVAPDSTSSETDSPVMESLSGLRDPSAGELTEAQGQITNLKEQVQELRAKMAVVEEVNLTVLR